jgi:tetratricopeptide (TPR) repeat protein
VAVSFNCIGEDYIKLKQYDKALESELKALKIYLKKYGEKNSEVSVTYFNIGKVYENDLSV